MDGWLDGCADVHAVLEDAKRGHHIPETRVTDGSKLPGGC